jgi:hypothetical protein
MRAILLAVLVAFAPSALLAQDHPAPVRAAVAEAEKICTEAGGKPTVRDGAVRNFLGGRVWVVDLDPKHFDCDGATSLFCGTGGCSIQVFVRRGAEYASVHDGPVRSWKLAKARGKDVLELGLHGSECGRAGYQTCQRTLPLE